MERLEVGRDARLAAKIDAVERGEPVEIVRDGHAVADVVRRTPEVRWKPQDAAFRDRFWKLGRELQEMVPSATRGGEGLVQRLREQDD